MVLVGADITRLRGLGSSMRVQSEYLSDIVTQVDHLLETTSWVGPDGDEFLGMWTTQLRPMLLAATTSLVDAGHTAEANADAQEAASSDGSTTTGASASPYGAGPTIGGDAGGPLGAESALDSGNLVWDDDEPDLTPEEEAAALAEGYTSRGGHVSNDAIMAFIELHSNDPEILGILFAGLGGRGTFALMQSYWNMTNRDDREISQIRDALAKGSTTWDSTTASQFAKGLLPSNENRGLPHEYSILVTYLFLGPTPLDGSLAAATASILESLNGLGDPGHDIEQIDLERAVLLTLAKDPDATRTYFSDPEHGVERRTHWFTDTDWSGQGFDVPATLLNATQLTADGKPITEAGSWAEQRTAAVLFSQLTRDLTRNPKFYPDKINDEAGRQLAQAVGINWALIQDGAQTTAYNDAGKRTDGETYVAIVDTLEGGRAYAPVIPRANLEWLLGVAGSTPSGAAVLDGTMASYRNRLFDFGSNGPGETNDRLADITARLVNAQEMVDRSVNAEALNKAIRADEKTKGDIALSLAIIGTALAPVTGGGSAAVGQAGAFMANTILTTTTNKFLGDWLANESTAAQTLFEKDVERQTKRAKMTTSALIAEILHIEIDPLPKLEDYPPPEADVVHIPNGVDYIIPNDNYESSLDFDGPYAKAVEQWNAKNYDRIEKAAKEAGLDHPSLDNILSNYEPTPYVDNKKPR